MISQRKPFKDIFGRLIYIFVGKNGSGKFKNTRELAKNAQTSHSNISNFINGRTKTPDHKVLMKLSLALGFKNDFLSKLYLYCEGISDEESEELTNFLIINEMNTKNFQFQLKNIIRENIGRRAGFKFKNYLDIEKKAGVSGGTISRYTGKKSCSPCAKALTKISFAIGFRKDYLPLLYLYCEGIIDTSPEKYDADNKK